MIAENEMCSTALARPERVTLKMPAADASGHRRLGCQIIMGDNEDALLRLWREKLRRGGAKPRLFRLVRLGVGHGAPNRSSAT